LITKVSMMIRKIKCQNIFDAPPPLFRREGREVRP
jgi:hypothetical protein